MLEKKFLDIYIDNVFKNNYKNCNCNCNNLEILEKCVKECKEIFLENHYNKLDSDILNNISVMYYLFKMTNQIILYSYCKNCKFFNYKYVDILIEYNNEYINNIDNFKNILLLYIKNKNTKYNIYLTDTVLNYAEKLIQNKTDFEKAMLEHTNQIN